jgi:aspartokinase
MPFSDGPGHGSLGCAWKETLIGTRIGEDGMESARVEAVTHVTDRSIVVAEGTAGARGEARGIIATVAETHPELELIAHEQQSDAHGAIVWMGSRDDAAALEANFQRLRGPGGEWKISADHGAAFVSLVGLGLGADDVVRAESALEKAAVPLFAVRTAPTAIILRVAAERAEDAVSVLHAAVVTKR